MTKDKLISKIQGRRMEWQPVNDTRPAAVMIPLVLNADRLEVVLEVRAKGLSQAGDVCLPGGTVKDGETSLAAAIRETCEELAVDASQIEVLAPMIATGGPQGRIVETFLCILDHYYGSYSRAEVDHILTVPIRYFYVAEPIVGDIDLIAQVRENFPCELLAGKEEPWFLPVKRSYSFYQAKGHVIWGLTATILQKTAEIIYGDEHPTREYDQ